MFYLENAPLHQPLAGHMSTGAVTMFRSRTERMNSESVRAQSVSSVVPPRINIAKLSSAPRP
eukprot:7348090-Prymnesium_polylepis.1